MTQQKKSNKDMPKPQMTFAQKFRNLPILEKEKVTNFFNLHNAATWVYLQMSEEAKEYTNEAVSVSSQAMQNEIHDAEAELNAE